MTEDSFTDTKGRQTGQINSDYCPDETDDDSSQLMQRRNLLALISSGTVTSIAGCGQFFRDGGDSTDSNKPGSDENTAQRVDTDQNSVLNKRLNTRKRYHHLTPEFNRATGFNYDEIDTTQGTGRFIAAPLEDGSGDRSVIQNPNGPPLENQRGIILSTFDAPVTKTYSSTNISGQDVEFFGGLGNRTVVISGVAQLQDFGGALLVARGETTNAVDEVLRGFDEFLADRIK